MSPDVQLLEQVRSGDADVRHRAALQVASSVADEELDVAFELLGDKDWRVRKAILDGLVKRHDGAVIRGLIDSLHDPENAGKRNSATEALLRIGEDVVPTILADLESEKDIDVRISLVNLLGDLRTESAFELLTAMLKSPSEDVNLVSSVIASLAKYRRAASVPRLIELLAGSDAWVKFHVIEALGEIGDRSSLPSILPMYAEKPLRKAVLEAVGRIADVGTMSFLLKILADEPRLNVGALRAMVQIAETEKPKVVEAAERLLIRRKFRESFPSAKIGALLEHLYAAQKREIRLFILKLLGWSGDPSAIGALLEFVEQPETAEVAAQAINDFGPAAMPAILERLRNTEDEEIAGVLLRVLGVTGRPEIIPAILPFLDHDSAALRRLAVEILGEIVDPQSVDYLLARLDDPDGGCQQAAVNAISALVSAFPEIQAETLVKVRRLLASPSTPEKLNSLSIYVNIQGEGYHDELLLASKDEDALIRQKAMSLMGKYSEQRFADQLVLSLADESPAVRLAAIQAIVTHRPDSALQPLISSLEDSDIWIRTAAAQALGEYRGKEVIPPLVRHLTTDLPPVRIAVIEALGKTGDPAVKPVLAAVMNDPDLEIRRAVVLATGQIPGDDVYEQLMNALRDPDWRIRSSAATALGNRGDRRALEELHKLLSTDTDPYVQQSIVGALDRLADRSSFPHLLRSLHNRHIVDEVTDLLVKHKGKFRDLLEEAWRTADSRSEVVIAAVLQAMKGSA